MNLPLEATQHNCRLLRFGGAEAVEFLLEGETTGLN